MNTIALDLLGGDGAPAVVADAIAALLADPHEPGFDLVVVGPAPTARALLAERGVDPTRVQIVDAGRGATMADNPLSTLRAHEDVTVSVAVGLVASGLADAWVSVGHSGAAVAAAVLGLGRVAGMSRPALTVVVPALAGPVVLLDVGAATDTTPTATQKITLCGTLAITSKSEAGQQVQVWIKQYGAATWTRASTVTVSSTGAWSLTRSFGAKTAVQARYFGSVALGAAQASSKIVTVSPYISVTAKTTSSSYAPKTSYTFGSTIYVPVAASGAPSGAVASLQKKSGSSWVTVATGKLSSTGKVTLKWKPTVRATYSLRVAVAGSSTISTGYSATMSRKVA